MGPFKLYIADCTTRVLVQHMPGSKYVVVASLVPRLYTSGL